MENNTTIEKKINVELTDLQAEQFVLFQKYYLQFIKLIEKKAFDKEFTGQIVLDILQGQIRNQKKVNIDEGIIKIESFHY